MTRRPRGRPKGSGGPVTVLTSDQVRDVLRAAVNSGRYSDRAQLAAMRVGDVVDVAGQLLESLSNARPELRRALANYCEQHVNPHAQQARLFRSQRGGALRPFSLASMLTSIYKCAGIRGASSRSGRKTALLTHSGRVSLRSEGIR
jgi:integrase